MKLRIGKLVLAGVAALAFATARPALANEDGDSSDDPSSQAKTDDGDSGKGGTNTDHADPSTKTLPSHASDNAREHAFGVWGAKQKAAHAAARAAAVKEAHRAANATTPTLPPAAIAGRAHAQGGGGRPDSPGQHGLETAAAHGGHAPNPHSGH